MPVNSAHPTYTAMRSKWARCRDCYEGQDAIHAAGDRYLPRLDSHRSGATAEADYRDYLTRATFYGAFRRTVQGLAGAVFQKPMQAEIPAWIAGQEGDVTLSGQSLEALALLLAREELITGSYGILVDMSADGSTSRPYWAIYRAEDVLNWRTDSMGRLTLVVLAEAPLNAKATGDVFEVEAVQQCRELGLDERGYYYQRLWRKSATAEWVAEAEVYPLRNGTPLAFIPFVFATDVLAPPLDDLAVVNLAHYRVEADLAHGLHYVGVPQLVMIGASMNPPGQPDKPLKFGPRSALELPPGGDAKILQADGAMLGALFTAEERLRARMASLGARLLEAPNGAAETATAVGMRHSGEQASLASIARELARDLTRALQIHAWWASRSVATPEDVAARVELNTSFFTLKASPDEVRAALELLQEGRISYATFYARLSAGGWARDGVTAEQEREAIEQAEGAKANDAARAALDGVLGDDGDAADLPAHPAGGPPIADMVLNGAQITAASSIVSAVARGEIPRDAGLGQLRVLLRLTTEQAEEVMGSSGTKAPTRPNPGAKGATA